MPLGRDGALHVFATAGRDGVVIHDQGIIVDANPQLAAMLGVPVDALRGTSLLDYLIPDDRARLAPEQEDLAKRFGLLVGPAPVQG